MFKRILTAFVLMLLAMVSCLAFAEVIATPEQQQVADIVNQVFGFFVTLSATSPILAKIVAWVMVATTLVGAASLAVEFIVRITKITPSKVDDEYATKLEKAVAWVVVILSTIARNPKTKK